MIATCDPEVLASPPCCDVSSFQTPSPVLPESVPANPFNKILNSGSSQLLSYFGKGYSKRWHLLFYMTVLVVFFFFSGEIFVCKGYFFLFGFVFDISTQYTKEY